MLEGRPKDVFVFFIRWMAGSNNFYSDIPVYGEDNFDQSGNMDNYYSRVNASTQQASRQHPPPLGQRERSTSAPNVCFHLVNAPEQGSVTSEVRILKRGCFIYPPNS